MDFKQLGRDIIRLNFSSFLIRWNKLIAVLKRRNLKPFNDAQIKQIPIIINNRNRLTYLLQLVSWLEKNGYKNIHIIDNKSTYPPLLDFYNSTKYTVYRLNENVGHLSLWKSGLIKKFEEGYYVYTDPDVLPVEECPDDILAFFMSQLNKYKNIEKVGFGLKIDDLPDHYKDKNKVINWEKQFWMKEIEKNIYDAPLDTTFALYRPYTNGFKWVQNAYRTGGKYVARHLPWYEDSNNLSEESIFYSKGIKQGSSHWTEEQK